MHGATGRHSAARRSSQGGEKGAAQPESPQRSDPSPQRIPSGRPRGRRQESGRRTAAAGALKGFPQPTVTRPIPIDVGPAAEGGSD